MYIAEPTLIGFVIDLIFVRAVFDGVGFELYLQYNSRIEWRKA